MNQMQKKSEIKEKPFHRNENQLIKLNQIKR